MEKLGTPSPISPRRKRDAPRRVGERARGTARRVAGILSLDSPQNVLIVCCILLLAAMQFWPQPEETRASRGLIDATPAKTSGRCIALSGEWALYWGTLRSPDDLDRKSSPEPDGFLTPPSGWTRKLVGGRRLPTYGLATLRLTVRHDMKGRELGVKINRINSAFRLYADGTLIASAGRVAEASDGFEGRYKPQSVYFVPSSDQTELVLQVANYSLPNGGILDAILFGTRPEIEAATSRLLFCDTFCLGGKSLFVIVFLFVFLATRSGLALLFSFYNLAMIARGSVVHELLAFHVWPGIDLGVLSPISAVADYITLLLHMLVIYAFVREATAAPDSEESRGLRAFFRDGGRPGKVMLASILLYCTVSLFYVIQYICLPGLNATAIVYILVPAGIFWIAYPLRLLHVYAARHDRHRVILWFYILYTCDTLFLISSRLLVTAESPLHPLFFLRLFPRLAELSRLEIQHEYLTYLVVVLFCIYFLYALILIRMDRAMARNRPPDLDRAGERLGITNREEEVMRLAVRGLTYDEIADACFISVNTVKTHLNSIYRKLDVKNKTELANKLREIADGARGAQPS